MPPQQSPTKGCAPSQAPMRPASASHLHHVGGYFHNSGLNHSKASADKGCKRGCSSHRHQGLGKAQHSVQTSKDIYQAEQKTCRARHCLRLSIPPYSHDHMGTSQSHMHIQHTSSTWSGSLWLKTQPVAHIFNSHTVGTTVHAQGHPQYRGHANHRE